jgi:hypothetical protein
MKVRINNTYLRAICAGAVVAAAGSATLAQSAGGGSFERPLRTQPAPTTVSQGRSTMVITQGDGQDQYEVRISEGKVSAKVNGKSVPQDRIVHEEDSIKILDENGDVLTEFQVSRGGAVTSFGGGGTFNLRAPGQPAAPRAAQPPAVAEVKPMPKVMLGIYMNEPGEDLRAEHDLDEGEGIVIERVVPELAAARAGIKEGDIIIEINGKKPATQEALREALKGKNPGDTVEFSVLREDGDRTIRVKLEKYDPEKLGVAAPPGAVWQVPEGGQFGQFEGWDQNKTQEEIERAQKEMQRKFRNYSNIWIPDGQGGVIMGPGATGLQGEARQRLDQRMQELDRKIAELDKKMAKLDDLIAKLEKSIEKSSGGRE